MFGQLVIIMLIQIGGLGFLTFLNLLLVMIRKKISLTNKLVMQEALNQSSLNEIPKFLHEQFKTHFSGRNNITECIADRIILIIGINRRAFVKTDRL